MQLRTERLALPLLATAQAQKEMTHNEALVLLDALVQPTVVSVAPVAVPTTPIAGQAWVVGTAPTGPWAGHAGDLAIFTAGGWRFVAAREGMQVWSIADSVSFRRAGLNWLGGAITATSVLVGGQQVVGARGAAVATPVGGAVIDIEARATLTAMLASLRSHGLIAT